MPTNDNLTLLEVFERDIAENPGDLFTRSVYADFLEEQGDLVGATRQREKILGWPKMKASNFIPYCRVAYITGARIWGVMNDIYGWAPKESIPSDIWWLVDIPIHPSYPTGWKDASSEQLCYEEVARAFGKVKSE